MDSWLIRNKGYEQKVNLQRKMINFIYDFHMRDENMVGSEVTWTFDPSRCQEGVASLRRKALSLVTGRLKLSKSFLYALLFYEEHKNGFPHIHGIVWYHKDDNNAQTLRGGRVYGRVLTAGCSYGYDGTDYTNLPRETYQYNQLGRTDIYPLRTTPYVKVGTNGEKVVYNNWLDYCMKDYDKYKKMVYFGKP